MEVSDGKTVHLFELVSANKDFSWNEQFSISLRKKKRDQILVEKRKRLFQSPPENENV